MKGSKGAVCLADSTISEQQHIAIFCLKHWRLSQPLIWGTASHITIIFPHRNPPPGDCEATACCGDLSSEDTEAPSSLMEVTIPPSWPGPRWLRCRGGSSLGGEHSQGRLGSLPADHLQHTHELDDRASKSASEADKCDKRCCEGSLNDSVKSAGLSSGY